MTKWAGRKRQSFVFISDWFWLFAFGCQDDNSSTVVFMKNCYLGHFWKCDSGLNIPADKAGVIGIPVGFSSRLGNWKRKQPIIKQLPSKADCNWPTNRVVAQVLIIFFFQKTLGCDWRWIKDFWMLGFLDFGSSHFFFRIYFRFKTIFWLV